MQSNDFEILVKRLKEEIKRNRKSILDMTVGSKETNLKTMRINQEYIDYHEEMISFIKRLDEEIQEKRLEADQS